MSGWGLPLGCVATPRRTLGLSSPIVNAVQGYHLRDGTETNSGPKSASRRSSLISAKPVSGQLLDSRRYRTDSHSVGRIAVVAASCCFIIDDKRRLTN